MNYARINIHQCYLFIINSKPKLFNRRVLSLWVFFNLSMIKKLEFDLFLFYLFILFENVTYSMQLLVILVSKNKTQLGSFICEIRSNKHINGFGQKNKNKSKSTHPYTCLSLKVRNNITYFHECFEVLFHFDLQLLVLYQ